MRTSTLIVRICRKSLEPEPATATLCRTCLSDLGAEERRSSVERHRRMKVVTHGWGGAVVDRAAGMRDVPGGGAARRNDRGEGAGLCPHQHSVDAIRGVCRRRERCWQRGSPRWPRVDELRGDGAMTLEDSSAKLTPSSNAGRSSGHTSPIRSVGRAHVCRSSHRTPIGTQEVNERPR